MALCPHLPQSETDGVLVPFLDRLNHRVSEPITWSGSEAGISMVTSRPGGIAAGDEVYQNYGPKSSLTMLLHYGFCLPDNVFDSYPLVLKMKTSADGPVTSLGPFEIKRKETPIGKQFPAELWTALADPANYSEDNKVDEENVAVDIDDVDMVTAVLQRQLGTLQGIIENTKSFGSEVPGDSSGEFRMRCISEFLGCQIVVINEALEVLEMMAGSIEEEEEEENEEGEEAGGGKGEEDDDEEEEDEDCGD
jgi:hypothetical protein